MKNDIDKIDEQIEAIQNARKKPKKQVKEEVKEEVVPSSDTKKLDRIDDIVDTGVETEEDTKKMNTIEEVSEPAVAELVKEETPSIEVVENKTEEKPPKKKIPVIYIVFGVVIVLLIAVLMFLVFYKKEDNRTKKVPVSDLSEKEKEQIIINYGDSIKALVGYYYQKDGRLLTYEEVSKMVKLDYDVNCRETEIHEDASIYLNRCRINNVSVKYSYGEPKKDEEKELPEGTIRVYVTNSGAVLKKPKDGIQYEVYEFTIDKSYYGLKLLDAKSDYIVYSVKRQVMNSYGTNTIVYHYMINFKTGKKALENLEYSSILPINIGGGKYDTQYAAVKMDGEDIYTYANWKIYNLKSGKSVFSEKYGVHLNSTEEATSFNGLFVVDDKSFYESNVGMGNYKTGDVVIPAAHYYCNLLGSNIIECGTLYNYSTYQYDKVYYDLSGKPKLPNMNILATNKDQFVLVRDDSNIKIMNYDGKTLYDYGNLNISNRQIYSASYKDGYMFKFVNGERPFDYDYDLEDSCVSIIYYPNTKKGEVKKSYCSKIDA